MVSKENYIRVIGGKEARVSSRQDKVGISQKNYIVLERKTSQNPPKQKGAI